MGWQWVQGPILLLPEPLQCQECLRASLLSPELSQPQAQKRCRG